MTFDSFRRSFEDLLNRSTRPEERRIVASRMRDTLVQAKMGLNDLRTALEKSRQRLAGEERELETVQRRKKLAEGISDQETVEIAAKYEHMHTERVTILRQKIGAEEAELAIAERDVEEMSAQLKAALSGADARAGTIDSTGTSGPEDALNGDDASDTSSLRDEIDSMGRSRARAEREADATRRLDELKRRMGK